MAVKAIGKIPSPKEITAMKRTIGIAILVATMGMALVTASAQSKSKATIPFSFRVGSALMPAGTYIVEYTQPKVVWFRNLDGNESAVAVATTTTGDAAPPVKLVFNRYGNQYFLSETRAPSGESEMTFSPSKLEKSIRTEEASRGDAGQSLVAMK
jgi:hypothetical protein